LKDVVIGTNLELEVTLMVGCQIDNNGDEGTLVIIK
jgi:hypothetical protein